MGIVGTVIGSDKVVQKLQSARDLFQANLTDVVQKSLINLYNHVVMNKLHGQSLHVRTARLVNSINWKLTSGLSGTSIEGSVGTRVKYAAVHEFGGVINIPAVTGKLMVFGNPPVFTMKHRAYQVVMPEHSFLRSSLEDLRERILADIREGINSTIKGM